MSEHPIQSLMKTTMENIKEMVDVNTIIGEAVETAGGAVIIPVSRVAFGYAAGGGDGKTETNSPGAPNPFGGGSGAGVSVNPVGFLVCSPPDKIRFLPVEKTLIYDRLIDVLPEVLSKVKNMSGCCRHQGEPEGKKRETPL